MSIKKKKSITIIGYGNVGKSLVHILQENFIINILSFSKNAKSSKLVTIFKKNTYENTLDNIYNDVEIALKNTDILIITVPNFLREEIILKVKSCIRDQIIIFIPGIGPSQFISYKYLRGNRVFCLERVPFISRYIDDKEYILDDRKIIKYASMYSGDSIDELLNIMFKKPVLKIDYQLVTLTSSNAILHTSRMYSIFNSKETEIFKKEIYFYASWDDKASRLFNECDNEIMKICQKLYELEVILNKPISLMEYYDSTTPKELTKKIKSIESFKNIKLKMLQLGTDKYILDKKTRFLTEDIPFGLLMFKGLAELVKIETPNIDKILYWAQNILGSEYIIDGKLIDFSKTGCPQNYNIESIKELYKVFNM